MRGPALTFIVALTALTGCALAFDEEQSSENLGRDASVDTATAPTDGGDDDTTIAIDTAPAKDTAGEDLACPGSEVRCGGGCTSLTTTANCGGCGNKCASNQVCANGICRTYTLRASACASGEADCSPLPGNTTRMCVAGGACPG